VLVPKTFRMTRRNAFAGNCPSSGSPNTQCGNHAQIHVGDHPRVKVPGDRIVEATLKAIVDTTDGVRLQVSFGLDVRFRELAGRC
jgi:hypothetical protein